MIGLEKQNTNVAWFKLAELIAKREREKALGIYRLLAHSLEDKAYALQIEGDILWSLEDHQAFQCYQKAAHLYGENQRWLEALAVYEHMHSIKKNDTSLFAPMLHCCVMLNWQDVFKSKLWQLYNLFKDHRINEEELSRQIKEVQTTITESKTPHTAWAQEYIHKIMHHHTT